jgi:hypothetical protein
MEEAGPNLSYDDALKFAKGNKFSDALFSTVRQRPEWLYEVAQGRSFSILHQAAFWGHSEFLTRVRKLALPSKAFLIKSKDSKALDQIATETLADSRHPRHANRFVIIQAFKDAMTQASMAANPDLPVAQIVDQPAVALVDDDDGLDYNVPMGPPPQSDE